MVAIGVEKMVTIMSTSKGTPGPSKQRFPTLYTLNLFDFILKISLHIATSITLPLLYTKFCSMSAKATTKNKNVGRSRFSDEQIQFLEYMFETQSRPELRMKQQLANQIGLQPRQVAIWFQNRRARSKSRQTEQEYNNLKHNYETLASKSESLKEENQALLTQLNMLRDLAKIQESGIANKSSNKECGNITLSHAENSKKLSENYSHEISVPFYAGTSYVGEDDRIVENEEDTGSFGSDRPSWWMF